MQTAPSVMVILRLASSDAPRRISQLGKRPAARLPKSAARNGNQAHRAMDFRSRSHTATR